MCASHVYSLLNEVQMVNAGFPASHQQGVSCPSQVVSSSCSTPFILILSCISHKMRLDNYIQPLIMLTPKVLFTNIASPISAFFVFNTTWIENGLTLNKLFFFAIEPCLNSLVQIGLYTFSLRK